MGKHGAGSVTTQLKVLLPGSSEKLRISDELAECFDSGDGGDDVNGMTAFLVSPFGTAVWHVEVGRDSHGAFLGRRWPEFAEAHGIGVGWFLVLRHEGRGVLTVKVFDGTCFIKEFGQILTVPGLPAGQIKTGRARTPQFVVPLCHDWMEKMPIPPEFLKRRYISDEELHSRKATFVTPFRGVCHVDLEKDGSNVFFTGVRSKFLESHGIMQGETLLIRYQGHMTFTVEVFGFTGCKRKLEKRGIRFEQTENNEETSSFKKTENSEGTNSLQETEQNEEANSSKKTAQSSKGAQSPKEAHISSSKRKLSEEIRRPKISINPLDKRWTTSCEYEIGSQPWIRKQLNTNAIHHCLPLPRGFCKKVGFLEKCTIKLKSSKRKGSWKVTGSVYEPYLWRLSTGWSTFCRDNELKEGDVCTFNVIKSTRWHVDIERC